ncbi:hypothetical protein BH10BAC3_BH10BAC3_27660 [soil metagenome]
MLNAKSVLTMNLWLLLPCISFAQNNWRSWNAASVNIGITKKIDVRVTHLRSYELNKDFNNTFNQTSASLSYDFCKNFSVLGGTLVTQLPSNNKNTNRYYARLSYKATLLHGISFSNSVQGEINSSNETRFHNRIIYIARIGNKKRFDFLKLNLSAAYWLYYNVGGNKIRYFDETGNVLARNSPDGFHRGRLYLNANSRISKAFSVSVYYMNQQEFNFFTPELRKINVTNPVSGKITRQFDNFNTIGITLMYDINLFKNK